METVPRDDLERLRADLPPDCLETGSHGSEDRPGMPPARDARTIFLGILCLIAVFACLYVEQDIVVPVVLALVLKLLLQPLVSLLERLHVPRPAERWSDLPCCFRSSSALGCCSPARRHNGRPNYPRHGRNCSSNSLLYGTLSSTCSARSTGWASD